MSVMWFAYGILFILLGILGLISIIDNNLLGFFIGIISVTVGSLIIYKQIGYFRTRGQEQNLRKERDEIKNKINENN